MRAFADRRKRGVALIVAVAVVAAGALMLWLRDDAGGAAIVPHRMLLSGRARGLYPGAWKAMRMTVRNPTRAQIVLMRVRARAESVAGCPGGMVRIRPFRGERPVPPGGRIRIRMVVQLSTAAPDACQGARFPVRFRARGVVA